VALRLLRFRRFHRHERGDAFASRSNIVIADTDNPEVRQPFVGLHSPLTRNKRIRLRITRDLSKTFDLLLFKIRSTQLARRSRKPSKQLFYR
jgi:hypothetical protein